jgi:hypothetical protein
MGGHVLRETTSRGLCGLVCVFIILVCPDSTVFSTNQTKPAQSTAKRVLGAAGARCVVRGKTGFINPKALGRCAAGWLPVRAVRCTVRGLFAMQCAARGLVAFARCAAMHGMRCVGRCGAMHGMRYNAQRAGWLHSRGALRCAWAGCIRAVRCAARDAMQYAGCSRRRRRCHAFDHCFFRWVGLRNGWMGGMGGRYGWIGGWYVRYGWIGWAVCEVWVDRWVEREGKGGGAG